MAIMPEMFDPVRPNLKHKTDVLVHERIPLTPCDLKFRPPSQEWPVAHGLVLPWLVGASCLGIVWGTLFRHPVGLGLLLSVAGMTLFLFAPVCVLGLIALTTLAARHVQDAWTRSELRMLAERLLVYPILLWLVAVATYFTNWPGGATLFLITLGSWTSYRLAERFATHGLAWMLAHPKIDRPTAVKWEADWDLRGEGFSSPAPRRRDLTAQQQTEFSELLDLRAAYRFSRLWLLVCWTGPILLALAGPWSESPSRPLLMGFGVIAALALWATVQWQRCPDSVTIFWRALRSWLNFQRDELSPPWVFETPVGPRVARCVQTCGAVMLISAAVLPLANWFPVHAIYANTPNTPAADSNWFMTALSEVGGGSRSALNGLAQSLLANIAVPVIVFLLTLFAMTAPVLSVWNRLLEVPNAWEHLPDENEFDGYVRRLQHSRNPLERNCLLQGYNVAHEYPVLLDTDLLFEHYHMVGATGIGKTALGLMTEVIQLIRRNDGPVVVVDNKGDPAFFQTVRLEAERAGRRFKWFTNQPNHSTYVFNPFQQSYLDRLSLHQIVGLFIQSLNLHHGDDYGRAWFSSVARSLMKLAIASTMPDTPRPGQPKPRKTSPKFSKIESFADLDEIITFLAKDGEEFQAARHLNLIIETLAEYEQLNFSPKHNPRHPAIQNAIHMPDVIRNREVVYFYLVGAIDMASVGEFGRLALYSLLTAAIDHRERIGRSPRCYFIADEAQLIIAQNIANVLAQARSYGVSCTLAHQSMSQLKPPGAVDLRELVLNCTSVKQYFSARDPVTQKYLADVSGQVAYYTQSWQQTASSAANGIIGLGHAVAKGLSNPITRTIDPPLVGINEITGPRLTPQDIQDVNHDPNQSLFLIERGQGLSQYQGAFPMHTNWPIAYREFVRRRDALTWPTSPETITVTVAWPTGNTHTITPRTSPADVTQRLNDIRRKLHGE